MRTAALLMPVLVLAMPAHAQTFTQDFESGTLDQGWFWTGNTPVFAPGYNSPWCISKESKDLCSPPLAEPWGMPFLFHPIAYDPTLYYSVSAFIRVEGAFKDGNIARIGLGWLDREGGYSFYYDNAETASHSWTGVFLEPKLYAPGFPGSEFGVVLNMDPAAAEAHGFFDALKVNAASAPLGISDADRLAVLHVAPNPATDRLNVTLPPDLRPLTVRLVDGQGRTVRDFGPQRTGRLELDVADVPAGLYLLQVVHAEGTLAQRVVKG